MVVVVILRTIVSDFFFYLNDIKKFTANYHYKV